VKHIARALGDAVRQLQKASDTARLDAELLMAEAFHIDRDKLILSPPDREVPLRFWSMVERRVAGEPVAYITGRRAFWNIELHVGPGALVPRPDSEVLIASAVEHFDRNAPARILDLGTGPGTLLLAALDVWPNATGLGTDLSRQALSYASANARRLEFEGRFGLAMLRDQRWQLRQKQQRRPCDPVAKTHCHRLSITRLGSAQASAWANSAPEVWRDCGRLFPDSPKTRSSSFTNR